MPRQANISNRQICYFWWYICQNVDGENTFISFSTFYKISINLLGKFFFQENEIYFIREITANTEELLFLCHSFFDAIFLHIWKRGYCTVPYNIEGNTWEGRTGALSQKGRFS